MVLPIGFFAPLPLPMMIPFMGIQSAVMAEQFGTMFQYGKRRISAMSNEEFNKLTPIELQQKMLGQLDALVPIMKEQVEAMRPMVQVIIKEFAAYIIEATKAVAGVGGGTLDDDFMEHLKHGHIGHPELLPPPEGSIPAPNPIEGVIGPQPIVPEPTPPPAPATDIFTNFTIRISMSSSQDKDGNRIPPSENHKQKVAKEWWDAAENNKTFGAFKVFYTFKTTTAPGWYTFNGNVIYYK